MQPRPGRLPLLVHSHALRLGLALGCLSSRLHRLLLALLLGGCRLGLLSGGVRMTGSFCLGLGLLPVLRQRLHSGAHVRALLL